MYKHKFEKATRHLEKAKHRLHGSENICFNQQSLIELQGTQIAKLKHKLKKYKRRVVVRDTTILELHQQIMMSEIGGYQHHQQNNATTNLNMEFSRDFNYPNMSENVRASHPNNTSSFDKKRNPFAARLTINHPAQVMADMKENLSPILPESQNSLYQKASRKGGSSKTHKSQGRVQNYNEYTIDPSRKSHHT